MVCEQLKVPFKADSMRQPLFSINIPMYNCEEFILEALKSIEQQTFRDWEIVLVDDGSTDGTLETCLRQKIIPSEKIKIIASCHAGQYATRRKLIENSLGAYIISLDADDMLIDSDSLEKIAAVISNHGCDVVLFNATRSLDEINKIVDYGILDADQDGIITSAEVLSVMSSSYELNNICFKAYRRTLWDSGENEREINNTEDRLQCAQILSKAATCALIDEPFYYYRPNPSSVTNKPIPFKFLQDLIYVEESLNSILSKISYDKEKRSAFLCQIVIGLLGLMRKAYPDRASRIVLYRNTIDELSKSDLFSNIAPSIVRGGAPIHVFAYRLLISNRLGLLDNLASAKEKIYGFSNNR